MRSARWGLTALSAVALAACGGGGDSLEWAGTVTDSAGVAIVSNPPDGAWTRSLHLELLQMPPNSVRRHIEHMRKLFGSKGLQLLQLKENLSAKSFLASEAGSNGFHGRSFYLVDGRQRN